MVKHKKIINVVNKYTGEVMSFSTARPVDKAQSYLAINETINALERAKDKIKDQILTEIGERGEEDLEVGSSFIWHRQTRRYFNYDLGVMRERLDEDLFNMLIKPDKTKIDEVLAESVKAKKHPVIEPEIGSELRKTMVEERMPVTALRLERISNEGK